MKTIWVLPLLVAVAACSKTPANNVAAANDVSPANLLTGAAPPANGPAAGTPQMAMPAGLDCIRNRLSPEERRGVAQAAAEQAPRGDPRAQPLVQAVDACAAELSWSPQKRSLAGMYSMTAAGVSALQQELTGQGIQLDELNQAIESDQELMAAANAGQLGSAGQAFAARHAEMLERIMGSRSNDQQLGTRIGIYIAFRSVAIAAASRFAQQP